jgi:hypothetical protein
LVWWIGFTAIADYFRRLVMPCPAWFYKPACRRIMKLLLIETNEMAGRIVVRVRKATGINYLVLNLTCQCLAVAGKMFPVLIIWLL